MDRCTKGQTHTSTHTQANSQWQFGAEPLSAFNDIEAQVLSDARDCELCQMVLTSAHSNVQMLQMSTKTDNLKTKKTLDFPPDTELLDVLGAGLINSAEAVE